MLLLALSAVVTTIGFYPYIVQTAKKIVRPRLVTWGVWCVLAVVMTVSALIEGHTASAFLSFQGVVSCLLVFIFGWRSGSREVSRLDIFCLFGASIGIISLVALKNPSAALLVSIAVDGIAFIPTLYHGWRKPFEEGLACYVSNFGASALVIASAIISSAGFMGVIYPIYSIVFNIAMVLIVVFGRATFSKLVPDYRHVDVLHDTPVLEQE